MYIFWQKWSCFSGFYVSTLRNRRLSYWSKIGVKNWRRKEKRKGEKQSSCRRKKKGSLRNIMGLLHSFKATFSFPFFCCKGNHSISDLSSVLTLCFPSLRLLWNKSSTVLKERKSRKVQFSSWMDFFERGPRRVNFATDSPSSVGNRRFRSTEKKERNSKPRIAQREFFRKIFRLKRCLNRRRLLLASLKQNNCETIAFSFPLHPHYYRVASA